MSDILGEDAGPTGPVANVGGAEEVVRVRIKVNGVTIEVTEKVIVKDILAEAKQAACFNGVAEEYVLERTSEEGELPREEVIVVVEAEEFLAVPATPTPVAMGASP